MSKKLAFAVSTAVVATSLTFAPIVAQEVGMDPDAGATTTTTTRDMTDDDGPNPGWLGLLGLIGLAGLMRRDKDQHHIDRTDRGVGTTHRNV